MKNSNDTNGNRSRDLPVCSAVPQPLRHRVPLNLFQVFTWICTVWLSYCYFLSCFSFVFRWNLGLDSSAYVCYSYTLFMFVTLVVSSLLRCVTALPSLLINLYSELSPLGRELWYDIYDIWYGMILYDIYLTAVGLTPGGSSTAHIYTQTIHRIQKKKHTYQSKN
jgi:hypothetical protein